MASITIRRLDPAVKERLRVHAARRGHTMEAEARSIVTEAVQEPPNSENLADIALALFGAEHAVELEMPPREPIRRAPDFAPDAW